MENANNKKVLILGLGNILLNDEGIGVRVVEEMEKTKLPSNTDILDGGTGGFVLLSLFHEYQTIIIIDATLSDEEPGTIKVLEPKFSSDFPKSLSTHELGMKDMIESAILLGKVPKLYLVAVTISPHQDMDMKVTPEIEKHIPKIINTVFDILKIIAGPLFDKSGALIAELDMDEIVEAKLDFDAIGHYSRDDIFGFTVNNQPDKIIE